MGADCCEPAQIYAPAVREQSSYRHTLSQRREIKNKLKVLYYEGTWAKSDPIVQLLQYRGIDFDYDTCTVEEWKAAQASGNGGEMYSLPIVT